MKPPRGRRYVRFPKCGYYGGRILSSVELLQGRDFIKKFRIRCSVCHFSTDKFFTPAAAAEAWKAENIIPAESAEEGET